MGAGGSWHLHLAFNLLGADDVGEEDGGGVGKQLLVGRPAGRGAGACCLEPAEKQHCKEQKRQLAHVLAPSKHSLRGMLSDLA
jgi:hypothetical protein